MKELYQTADRGTICSKLCSCERPILQGMCISGGQGSTHPSRPLLLLPSVYENAVKPGPASSIWNWWDSSAHIVHERRVLSRLASMHLIYWIALNFVFRNSLISYYVSTRAHFIMCSWFYDWMQQGLSTVKEFSQTQDTPGFGCQWSATEPRQPDGSTPGPFTFLYFRLMTS